MEHMGIFIASSFVFLTALYFVIKWGVKHAIIEAQEMLKKNSRPTKTDAAAMTRAEDTPESPL